MDNAHERDEAADMRPLSRPRRFTLSARTRRVSVLSAILVLLILGYGTLLTHFDVLERPGEQRFGNAEAENRVELYVEPIAIDPVNDSMQMRISVSPIGTGQNMAQSVPGRDLVLIVRRENQIDHIQIAADRPYPEATFAFDLNDGAVHDYPLDRYTSQIDLSCFEAKSNKAVPIHITNWEGILGFTVRAHQAATFQDEAIHLDFAVSRTGAIKFFGIAAYGAMIVMALSAVTIGTLVFVGARKVEVTLVGAIGAIVFALPAMRNALPGTPPLGVSADILVFFWAELGTVIALGLFVITWARNGPKP
jgi:hypothetical protein